MNCEALTEVTALTIRRQTDDPVIRTNHMHVMFRRTPWRASTTAALQILDSCGTTLGVVVEGYQHKTMQKNPQRYFCQQQA